MTWVPFEHAGTLIQKFHKLNKEEQKAFQLAPSAETPILQLNVSSTITVPGIIPVSPTEFKCSSRSTRKILFDMQRTMVFVLCVRTSTKNKQQQQRSTREKVNQSRYRSGVAQRVPGS